VVELGSFASDDILELFSKMRRPSTGFTRFRGFTG
jgi:hypothetical protein